MKSWEAITSTSGSVKRPRSAWSGDWRSWAIRLSWSLPLKSSEEQISSLLFQKRTLYRPQRSERRFLRFGQARNTGDVHPLVEPVSHPVHALACPCIPADNCSVLTCAQHHPPIGAKDHCPDPARMTVQRVEARSAAHFPHPHRSVMPTTGKRGAIRAEGDRLYPTRVPLQYLEALARAHLPHPHRPIITAAGKHGPIGAEGDRPDPTDLPMQYLQALC